MIGNIAEISGNALAAGTKKKRLIAKKLTKVGQQIVSHKIISLNVVKNKNNYKNIIKHTEKSLKKRSGHLIVESGRIVQKKTIDMKNFLLLFTILYKHVIIFS